MNAHTASVEERLIVFAKTPRLGKVKTRLSPPLTEQQALELHCALLEVTLERLAGMTRARLDYWLYLSDSLENTGELAIPSPWEIRLQQGDGLGMRLENAFRRAFEEGIHRLVVVGSDSPTVPLHCIDEAFDQLTRFDAVLGPSLDGGYYLVGSSRLIPELFQDIPWGDPTVLRRSAEALNRARRSFTYLIDWYDVDTDEDLLRLRDELAYYARECPEKIPRRLAEVLPEDMGPD